MITAPALCTDRLILRDITVEDTELIIAWRSDPGVYRYFLNPHPLNKEEHLNWYYSNYIFNPDRLDFMVVVRNTRKAAGVFGIKRVVHESREAEVSYILAPEERGRGYASEALFLLHDYLKTEWKCQKAIAEIHRDNHDSVRFVEKQGYRCRQHHGVFWTYEKEL